MTELYTWCSTRPDEPWWDGLTHLLRDYPRHWDGVRVWCDLATGDTHATYGTWAGVTWHADGHMTLLDDWAGPALYCLMDVVYLAMGDPAWAADVPALPFGSACDIGSYEPMFD